MGLDLNLLVPLDALLQECSVTRAAQRLGLSQPTVSAALARLRRHFGDELLTRVGNAYELTPLAERLAEQTAQALGSADRVFQTRPDFDPAQARREFTLVVTDVHLATFGRTLAALVRDTAPGVRLRFQHLIPQIIRRADEHLRTVDAARFPITGRGGESLSDKWAGGVRTLHGILAVGFPNLFLVGSPAQAAFPNNYAYLLYGQGSYVSTLVKRCLDEGFTSVEVHPEAEERWAQQIKERAAGIPAVDFGCAPTPYGGLISSGYPGGPVEYLRICREWLEDGWQRDLIFRSPSDATA
ncbi:LysR family transcriptional regulator [Streptomyces sp. NPDC019937]|uniref:LysR family transcriptional regulator n=1 Tax=Streptomyces sp. NPDC019937 TaxID=3154787 RepID=UPI0033FEA334